MRARASLVTGLAVAALSMALACGFNYRENPGAYGWRCNTKEDCRGALTCEPLGNFTTQRCTVDWRLCTLPCAKDSDCAPLGGNFGCERSCGGSSIGLCLDH